MLNKWARSGFWIFLFALSVYGIGRLYYFLTDGFAIENIKASFVSRPKWNMHTLSVEEQKLLDDILSSPFYYLGKGCQSYVFISEDQNFVIKFFKYQRYRPKPWVDWFSFIPIVDSIRKQKIQKKEKKLERVYKSWKLAFDYLQKEGGVVFAHLNNDHNLNRQITIYDKMGFKHILDLDPLQFLVQRKATMICQKIDSLMAKGKIEVCKDLLDKSLEMMLAEHERGLVDDDHALMQNTGVIGKQPIHIDVGLFANRESVKELSESHLELFKKTYKFGLWLKQYYPELADYLDKQLYNIIGDPFLNMVYVEDQH